MKTGQLQLQLSGSETTHLLLHTVRHAIHTVRYAITTLQQRELSIYIPFMYNGAAEKSFKQFAL